MKIYLGGPMRGYHEFNFSAFNRAAERLRAQGYEVFSPAEKGCETNLTEAKADTMAFRRRVFSMDTGWICKHAEAVALLPGWESSSGATAERALAETLGLTIIILGREYTDA